MLHEFVATRREDIMARTRERVRSRPWPSFSIHEIEYGVPLFLTQLTETLRLERTPTPFSSDAIGSTATRHAAELLAAGCNVAQVVHGGPVPGLRESTRTRSLRAGAGPLDCAPGRESARRGHPHPQHAGQGLHHRD